MKTLFSRLISEDAVDYSRRYARLRDAFVAMTASRWEDASNSAVFLAGGSARENHDQLRLAARLREDDMLCVIDHAKREVCCSGAPSASMLQYLASSSGYKMVGSHSGVLSALMATPRAGNSLVTGLGLPQLR